MAFKLLYVAAEMLTVCCQRLVDYLLKVLRWNGCLISGDLDDGMPFVTRTPVWYGFSIMRSEIGHSVVKNLFRMQEVLLRLHFPWTWLPSTLSAEGPRRHGDQDCLPPCPSPVAGHVCLLLPAQIFICVVFVFAVKRNLSDPLPIVFPIYKCLNI